MNIENIEAKIKEGTVIGILDNKISSKEKDNRYFSGRWLENQEVAESFWKEIIEKISKYHDIEIIEKEYPTINRSRRELIVGNKIHS